MDVEQTRAAVEATKSTAMDLGLTVDSARVLHNSNRLAVHLSPCDVLARVAPADWEENAAFEVEVAGHLMAVDAPVGGPEPRVEPRVYLRDGFAITLWTYFEPVAPQEVEPREFADALERLHVSMRRVELAAPHFTDRVAEAQHLVGDPVLSPELVDADRELLVATLRDVTQAIRERGAPEQLLHGEPHPGNALRTRHGLLFIDLQTCCRGPIEFDIAHAEDDVGPEYRNADPHLVGLCRTLKLAMVASWRWDKHDEFPDGREMGEDFVRQIRALADA